MLQLRKVRFYTPQGQKEPVKYDAPLTPDIVVKDVPELLNSLNSILEKIPKTERFNLFFTVGHVKDGGEKTRTWASQDMFFFDIDGIDIDENGSFEEQKYLQAVSKALNVAQSKMVVIYTGHGLHVLLKTKKPWSDAGFFKKNRLYYSFACTKINETLKEYGLKGSADRAVFAQKFMSRLPLTLNKKPGRAVHEVRVLTHNLEPIEFDLKKLAGLPDVAEDDQLSEKALTYFKIDSPTVEEQCLFLKDVKQSGGNVDEPTWYAALSIVGRLENGKELAHEYSRGHRSYSVRETSQKVEQALQAAGPRTCDAINTLWGGCSKCPHYKKVRSPISLRGDSFIATAHSGFHLLGKKGSLVPQFEDLRKYYNKELPYINVKGSHYRYEKTHWEEVDDTSIDGFAQEKFHPPAKNNMRAEFRGLIKCTNLKARDFFLETTDRLINLRNGVLNIDTLELVDHNPRYGFRQTLDFDFDPQADCPTFDKMLAGVSRGDKDTQQNLLEFMGYALSGDVPRAEKVLVLTGGGSNGKTTFLQVLRALGGRGVTSLSAKNLSNDFFRQQLDGALFNISEEMPPFVKKDFWEDVKNLASGGLVTASRKFKDPYSFTNRAKIILTCNKLPPGTDPTHGFFRKLNIVPFNATFSHDSGNIDVDMAKNIKESELPGVLNRALKAHRDLVQNKYSFTASGLIDDQLEQYKKASDSVYRWCEEFLVLGKPTELEVLQGRPWLGATSGGIQVLIISELYKTYRIYTDDSGEKPVSRANFSARLDRWVRSQITQLKNGKLVDATEILPEIVASFSDEIGIKRRRIGTARVSSVRWVRWVGDAEY